MQIKDFDLEREEVVKVNTPINFWKLSIPFSSIYITSQLYHSDNYVLALIWIVFILFSIKNNNL